MGLGWQHILLFALLLLLVFGGNRFSNMMSDVAKGLKNFKKGMSEEDEPKQGQAKQPRLEDQPINITPQPTQPAEPTAPPPADDQTRS